MKFSFCLFALCFLLESAFEEVHLVGVFIEREAENYRKDDRNIEGKHRADQIGRNVSEGRQIERHKNNAQNHPDEKRGDDQNEAHQPEFDVVKAEQFDRFNSDHRVYRRNKRARIARHTARRRHIE